MLKYFSAIFLGLISLPIHCMSLLDDLSIKDITLQASNPEGKSSFHELKKFIIDRPWIKIAANSEQRQPVYIGKRPREIELGGYAIKASLPISLKKIVEKQAAAIREALVNQGLVRYNEDIELEGWPTRNDKGQLTWTFAWYQSPSTPWQRWIKVNITGDANPPPFLPEVFDPSLADNHKIIFGDILEFDDLYQKPIFGDLVWLDASGGIMAAWLPPEAKAYFSDAIVDNHLTAILLPQPARDNGVPISYKVIVNVYGTKWTSHPNWERSKTTKPPKALGSKYRIRVWPTDFKEAYKQDVMLLSGELEASFPLSGKKMRFIHKNNIEESNQLDQLVSYLEERYMQLGIQTRRQTFLWRGKPQTNLIAILPGYKHGRPILMGDHIDTAFCEDIFKDSNQTKRVSAPGADDNMSAVAALLRAANILKGKRLGRDIWLVHFTGEEFPADDLGARYFVSELLSSKTDIGGLILMDMIGWRQSGDRLFQISSGESLGALRLAVTAKDAAKGYPELRAILRTRFDPRSYLFNTDGLIFSEAGFPVILLNENLNAIDNFSRPGYHDTSDTSSRIDWDYATTIVKIAITTAARLAGIR